MAPDRYCADVTTDEARAFAEDLDDAGLDVAAEREYRLEYDFQAEHQAGVHLFFEPYLPHGEMICSPCG